MTDVDQSFWRDGARDGRRRIEDYGLIGDRETAALVSRTGSIDWLCWPRFDSGACLAALLGNAENGFWRVAPRANVKDAFRRYRGNTLILESRFVTEEGEVELVDLMPLRGKASDIVRIVRGRSGKVRMRSVLDLRFDYGALRPLVDRVNGYEISALAGPHAVVLRSSCHLKVEGSAICCDFELRAGESVEFVLTYFASYCGLPDPVDPYAALGETEHFWSEWAGRCTYEGPYREQVVRSLITLKALTYRPTGGTVAAATTSLPEKTGGTRNWDYRYCWLRDAAFMLLAFVHAGYKEEAQAWRNWLLRAVAGEPSHVKPLYALDGDKEVFERELPWLSGFNDGRPVRVGNAAHDQLQIDVFGEMIDAFHLARKHGLPDHKRTDYLQRSLLKVLESRWRQPDSGIWEIRARPRHFVHSKALAWVAFDRMVREEGNGAWDAVRRTIRNEVLDKGFNADRKAFRRDYDSDDLDASTLLLPLVGIIDPNDPRAVGTTHAIERDLMENGLVLRYRSDTAPDGLPPGEGAFLSCSFWLADNYHLQGRREEAVALFERLCGLSNDLGLLAEEYDPAHEAMLGNFPQALSHVGLINTAYNLSAARGPAVDRLGNGH
ncbi:glycoside hydrolase family 15 protein [Pedomonas mirosovicensis]|uniref:glycoside hydrolase family 15 protein n=1 Tax=Pedomonas mirosovicensis TaxID=2908641 RepID=UPI0021673F93|nr:glycoside hydrolase family 15 protein [Pedomonas mirosovicensis]MCH8686718.1 glycoside hydrolase family 15 protein [Pedomonas mirosovicensis]